MGVVVSFSYSSFVAAFPVFSYLSEGQVQTYWNLATQYCRNDGGGPVCDATSQTNFLNLLTAHLCQLFAPTALNQNPSTIVGRISNASEGSVSVATQNEYPPGTSQWYQQTPYGSAAWEAMKPYRTMRYVPGYVRRMSPWPYQ